MNRITAVCAGLLFIVILGCASCQDKAGRDTPSRLQVAVTLFPLYDMARTVAGGKADVSMLLRPGVEAHAFEPAPADIIAVAQAGIFIYTGAAMEPWAADILRTAKDPGRIVVDASRSIALAPDTGDDEHAHHNGGADPHIWLDFANAQSMVATIAEGFSQKDPANRAFYEKNAAVYNKELAALDEEYRNGLARCATRELIHAGHKAFGYLAHRYRLDYHSAAGFAPDAETSPESMVALAKRVKERGGRAVFYEELVLPKVAEAIARNTGVPMLQLNAAHNLTPEQMAQGTTFISLMRQNLAALRQGLACE